MKHGSLFSGIGGFDLAAQRVGFENIFQVEIDKFCQKVLTKNFPGVEKYLDIKDFDGTKYANKVDIISGGFPCQPFSHAGKRKGDKDERALFPEMFRVVREAKPRWIVAENVGGILSINDGEYFEEICTSLESEGYAVQSFIIPASAVNAPHRRDRVWFVAHSGHEPKGNDEERNAKEANGKKDAFESNVSIASNKLWTLTNTNAFRPVHGESEKFTAETGFNAQRNTSANIEFTSNSPSTRLQRSYKRNEAGRERPQMQIAGISWEQNWYEVATRFCRVDDGVSHRMDRLKGLGNAIVPQIAQIIFEAIKQYEEKK